MSSELQLDVWRLNRWWRHLVNAYEVNKQDWRKVMATYHWGDDLKAAGWLPVHQDQLRAQLSERSMGELYFLDMITIILRLLWNTVSDVYLQQFLKITVINSY